MKNIINQNLNIRQIETNLKEIEEYFMAITFSLDDIYWIIKNSRAKPPEKIMIGAFLNLSSEELKHYHEKNFWLVRENLRKLQTQKTYHITKMEMLKYPILSFSEKLVNADENLWRKIYNDICMKSGANYTEILAGVLVTSRGCEEISFCPRVKENGVHWLNDCLKNAVYIDFQTTLFHFRGFGIGSKLIYKGFEILKKNSENRGFVRVSTMTANPIIKKFHDSLGSDRLATIPGYYPDGSSGILYCNQLKK
jgi:ribosomal protein S18 acetylase RimI-like enzyme